MLTVNETIIIVDFRLFSSEFFMMSGDNDGQTETPKTPTTASICDIKEIWQDLRAMDREENDFQFSSCRNRQIVILGPNKTNNHAVGDVIRRSQYAYPYYQARKDEQKTVTYVMVPDDANCNVCIANVIDIPPLENFVKRSEKTRKDPTISPILEVDQCIYRFATKIDLIILVCDARDILLMKAMKKLANDRRNVMALAMIVSPEKTNEERDNIIADLQNQPEFLEAQLKDFFQKGIFCLSNFSYKQFANEEQQQQAQLLTQEWRSKFLRTCVGGPKDPPYTINLSNKRDTKDTSCSIL